MVVGWKRVPDAILVVMMLAVGYVFRIAHCHLLATVPTKGKRRTFKTTSLSDFVLSRYECKHDFLWKYICDVT